MTPSKMARFQGRGGQRGNERAQESLSLLSHPTALHSGVTTLCLGSDNLSPRYFPAETSPAEVWFVAQCGSVPASPCVAGKLLPELAPALHASPGFSWIRQFLTLMSLLSSDLSNSLHTSFNSLWSEGLEEPQKIPSARYPAHTHTCSP